MKYAKRIILAALASIILFFAVILANILYSANFSSPEKADVIIVLGCQIKGGNPSLSLQYRLEKALELYKAGYADNIITSGGQGSNEIMPEGKLMKRWLVERGADSTKVFEEDKSHSTYENLVFSKEIMNSRGYSSAIIVSNDFHIYRSLRIAKNLEIEASGAPAPNVWYLIPYSYSREVLSVIKSYVTGK